MSRVACKTCQQITGVHRKGCPNAKEANMCEHKWISNSGNGGEPVFKKNLSMSMRPVMHVKCSECNARTWMTEDQWEEASRA